jgi:hypothetical protein
VVLVVRNAPYTPLEYYRRDLHPIHQVRTDRLSVVLSGVGYASGCREPASPLAGPATSVAVGGCWKVLHYDFAQPRLLSADDDSLLAG